MSNEKSELGLVTVLLILLTAFVLIPLLFMGVGMLGGGPMMGGMWDSGMWDDGTIPGWLLLAGILLRLLFLAALVVGGYLIYKTIKGRERDVDPALEELRLAYARGELTDEEYEQRRDALERDTDSR